MEFYEISCLEKQREKAKKPSFHLIEKPIEKLQACSNESHFTDTVNSHYGESAKQQVWKDDMCKVILSYKRKLVITSKWIYEIMLRAEMESYLKLSENLVFDDRLEDIEMSYHHVMVRYVIDVLRMFLLLRGSVKVSTVARPILREWFPNQLTRTE